MAELLYNRQAARAYAKRWALGRNPAYYDFSALGGDCTNFASQCIFTGAGVMNFTPTFGWYYRSVDDRAPAWTGAAYLLQFLLTNSGAGPFGMQVARRELQVGDAVFLLRGEVPYHTLFVSAVSPRILVCAHSDDALDRPLTSYSARGMAYVHIAGVRASNA